MVTKEKVRRTPAAGQRRRTQTTPVQRQNRKPSQNRKREENVRPLQDVVYLPPKPFRRNRLLLRLATVAAVVLAVVLALSLFFKVEHFEIAGAAKYDVSQIREASGIQEGDNLFSFGMPGASARILSLPYIKSVRIGIRLPNTVLIEVTEFPVTYAVKAQDDSWWLVGSTGKIVEKAAEGEEAKHTKILGVHLLNPQVGSQCVAQETAKPEVDEEGNTIPVTVTAAKRLQMALAITEQLEANNILGEIASIDVNNLGDIQLWHGEKYQVKLGDSNRLADKIHMMKLAVDKLSQESHNSGVLDITFKVESDGVRYTPFQ